MLFSCIHSSASNGFSQPGITPLVPECRWTKLHQSCLTLCDPMDCSLSIEFSRQEYWSGLPFPSLGDLPDPGIKPDLLHCRQIFNHLIDQGNPALKSVLNAPATITITFFQKISEFCKGHDIHMEDFSYLL